MHGGLCEVFVWLDDQYAMDRDRQAQGSMDALHDRWHEVTELVVKLDDMQIDQLREDALNHIFSALTEIVKETENATR